METGSMEHKKHLCERALRCSILADTEETNGHMQGLVKDYITTLENELHNLHKFKSFVHDYLDKTGVPADPDPEKNKATGCRISCRLDWLQNKLIASEKKIEEILDDGELWSFFRGILVIGGAQEMDYANGKYKNYEVFSAHIDATARNYVEKFHNKIQKTKELSKNTEEKTGEIK